jgi:hypothetical protein
LSHSSPCSPAARRQHRELRLQRPAGCGRDGRGLFERAGIPTSVPLLAAFLLVCLLEAVAGFLLWRGSMAGAVLALVLLPLGRVFWWGFALPIPPIFALVWTILIFLSWQALR